MGHFMWSGFHNVFEAPSKEAHGAGTNVKEVSVETPTTGVRYFICEVGSHCSSGQKLKVAVIAAAGGDDHDGHDHDDHDGHDHGSSTTEPEPESEPQEASFA